MGVETTTQYQAFLTQKALTAPSTGRPCDPAEVNPILFSWQRQLVAWCVRKGRCALLASTGLGKSFMQIEWARLTGERTLILAPLAVSQQTAREGAKLGVPITYARSQSEAAPTGITITNYERLDRFEPAAFGAVVLDESSVLKHETSKTRTALIQSFARTPYRLCCSATPAPNDIAEIANHAEFLGVMSRPEMLASFFVNDNDRSWRLKGWAADPFYRWLASWAMSLNMPSDIGGSDTGYDLPPLTIEPVIVETDYVPEGRLFADRLHGVTERASVRRSTVKDRIAATFCEMEDAPDEPWICWYGLLEEGRSLSREWGDEAVLVEGSLPAEEKEARLLAFVNGQARILITHPKLGGFGLNLQHCAKMAFVGLSDSWESYYQCIRRCWRFGQTREVKVYIVLTEPERVIYENVLAKEREARQMSEELVKHVAEFERVEIGAVSTRSDYAPGRKLVLPRWLS